MTFPWVFEYSILNAINTIALPKHFIVYQAFPDLRSNEIRRSDGTGSVKEGHAPGTQIVEIQGWGAYHNAIKILGVFFCGF
jgi:hypothetical protein